MARLTMTIDTDQPFMMGVGVTIRVACRGAYAAVRDVSIIAVAGCFR